MTPVNLQENQKRPFDSLIQLEFAKVVRLVADYTQTSYGYKLALMQVPDDDIHQIRRKLGNIEETLQFVAEEGSLSLAAAKADLSLFYEQLKTEGLKVQAKTLLEVLAVLEVAAACRHRLIKSDLCPSLSQLAQKLSLFPELVADIHRSVGVRAEILDSASFEIADLRESLKKERRKIKQHLEKLLQKESLRGVFQELIFTERNGRYVLPVRADHAGQIKGFVHDVSASGQTLYLEPSSALQGNNKIQTLLREIDREEERVLLRLSARVREVRREMAQNQEILARLDVLHAIAGLSLSMGCVVPTLLETPSLKLHDARHPLLVATQLKNPESSPVVPIEVVLHDDCQVLIVSGPNAGGKTVALKTVGLLVLMTRAGFPIPCAIGSSLYPLLR
jgi:DNA mismatch repair protein MutS2